MFFSIKILMLHSEIYQMWWITIQVCSQYKTVTVSLFTVWLRTDYLGNIKTRISFHLFLAFVDGTTMELVSLTGTIPVSYRGSSYNIPICIWLIDTHPKNAPICYVKPTADMSIKVSMFVDQNGKIYLPYLHDWVPVSWYSY